MTLIAPTLLICIVFCAALLRLDALFASYGPNPDCIGEYRVNVPRDAVNPGIHLLALRSDAPFKVWCVRIVAR